MLEIETAEAIYEIEFGYFQLELTSYCNMACLHCRASNYNPKHMPVEQIKKLARFACKHSENCQVVLSGGEPLLHPRFLECLNTVAEQGIKRLSITTNGFLLKQHHIDALKVLPFERVVFSVSLDSIYASKHDAFRRHQGAHRQAIAALELLRSNRIYTGIRVSVKPTDIDCMQEIANYAHSCGCNSVGFSAIQPAGRALENSYLTMNMEQKRHFLQNVVMLQNEYPAMEVGTTDPLLGLLCREPSSSKGELLVNGCGAGITTFNVEADGWLTPCALLSTHIMQAFPLSIEEIERQYSTSSIIHTLLDRKFTGKCEDCRNKYDCGGCRARALAAGDLYGEDPHCWL